MNADVLINRITLLSENVNIKPTRVLIDSGAGKDFIANLRKGQVPAVDKVAQIADFLDTTTDYLLGRTDNPDTPPLRVVNIDKEYKNMTIEEACENLIKAAKREYGYRSPESRKKLDDLGESGELSKNPKLINFVDKFLRKYEYEAYTVRDGLVDYLTECLDIFDSLAESVLLAHNIDPARETSNELSSDEKKELSVEIFSRFIEEHKRMREDIEMLKASENAAEEEESLSDAQ